MKKLPVIAIVGRPNVGKSTLFNRILRERKAIVHDEPGLTRDRHYGHATYQNRPFILIDTGGYEDKADSPLLSLMREQTLLAIEEADRVIFVTEEAVPSDPIDAEIVQRLRASQKPFFLAVNKADNFKKQTQAYADFSIHGLDMVYPVSALHGEGVFDLLDDVTEGFAQAADLQEDPRTGPIRVALVGRQNVGKSTLTNRLLGHNRMIACDLPGTTRDSIDTDLRVDGEQFTLIDTAGIRRRGKIGKGPEKLSVHSSFSAIDRCDVALLLIDIAEGLTSQDEHVAGYAVDAGKAVIICLNKWDKVKDRENYGKYIKKIRDEMGFLRWAPIVTISAVTGQRTHKLWGLIRSCAEQYRREFGTRELNTALRMMTSYVSPPVHKGRALQIKYVTQVGYCPPRFALFVNDPELVHFSYERFLSNQFRKHFDIEGTPLRLSFRPKSKEHDRAAEEQKPQKAVEVRRQPPESWEEEFEAAVYEEDGV